MGISKSDSADTVPSFKIAVTVSSSWWSHSTPVLRLTRFYAKRAISRNRYGQFSAATASGEQVLHAPCQIHTWSALGRASVQKSPPGNCIMNGTGNIKGVQSRASLANYEFPKTKLKSLKNPSKQPIALIACGSFSPVTRELPIPWLLF